jgi:hypothetical protein
MGTDKPVPKSKVKKDKKISSADDLIKTGKSGDIELDEEALKRVAGGSIDDKMKY